MCFPGRPARPPSPQRPAQYNLSFCHMGSPLCPLPLSQRKEVTDTWYARGVPGRGRGLLITGAAHPTHIPSELGALPPDGCLRALRVGPPTWARAPPAPLPRPSYRNRTHLMHKDVHRRVERDPGAGGHGQEAEPHAHVEPLTDAGPVQQLRLLGRPRRVLPRLLGRLGAATWRQGGRSIRGPIRGGHGFRRPGPKAAFPSRRVSDLDTPGLQRSVWLARNDLCRLGQREESLARAPRVHAEAAGAPKVLLLCPHHTLPVTDGGAGPSSLHRPRRPP